MGRKRLDNKKVDLTLSIDPHLVNALNSLKINKSAFFTDAALEYLEQQNVILDFSKKDKDEYNENDK